MPAKMAASSRPRDRGSEPVWPQLAQPVEQTRHLHSSNPRFHVPSKCAPRGVRRGAWRPRRAVGAPAPAQRTSRADASREAEVKSCELAVASQVADLCQLGFDDSASPSCAAS